MEGPEPGAGPGWSFFSSDTATPEISTLSLHDALPISRGPRPHSSGSSRSGSPAARPIRAVGTVCRARSEEHTSELQSRENLVCRLLLEKKNPEIIFPILNSSQNWFAAMPPKLLGRDLM